MTQAKTMTDSELDIAYTDLCKTMTRLGEAQSALFLARFALDKVVNYLVRQGTVVGNLSIAFLSQSSLTRERHSHSSLTRASKGR